MRVHCRRGAFLQCQVEYSLQKLNLLLSSVNSFHAVNLDHADINIITP
ncbi:MAG: hypothetical protein BWX51_02134 [Bacteroidetes bacterium ADurb.Bin012]|nr:MAG: hypothetical protein BWX51_02134 [Bacteroidetes bacterium ADurb.Bin012]